ncbi:MAG TPA: hypothetical protein DCP31_21090 [Cyanobacteria bacterium UBA8543]|nr:hypothetical protein [Cyanobacteria bacterium UBA8543]
MEALIIATCFSVLKYLARQSRKNCQIPYKKLVIQYLQYVIYLAFSQLWRWLEIKDVCLFISTINKFRGMRLLTYKNFYDIRLGFAQNFSAGDRTVVNRSGLTHGHHI